MERSEEINAGLTVSEDACGKPATVGTLEPSHIIPVTCRGLLQVGDLPAALTGNGFRVADIKCPFEALLGGSDIPDRAKDVDDIVLGPHPWSQGELLSCLSRLQPLMGEYSQISILWISQSDMPFHLHHIDRALASIGLMRYRWGILDAMDRRHRTWALVMVKSAYNPVSHCRELSASGDYEGAIKVLDNIPPDLILSDELRTRLAWEKQKHYLAWQRHPGALDPYHARVPTYPVRYNRFHRIPGGIDRNPGGKLTESAPDHCRKEGVFPMSPNRPDFFLGLVKGENYGWGVCSRYLMEELPKLRSIRLVNDHDGSSCNLELPAPLFQALTTVGFAPLFESARGTRNYGYTFFENELTRQSIENAKRYDRVLAGSSWCRDRMLEAGITNCDILIQGIDPKRFHPITDPTSDDRFVIFSGGKFELRKGQDLVLRAVKILQDKYPDIHLVNCWYNLWPESLKQMRHSPHICFNYRAGESWQETLHRTYVDNGLDPNRITTMDLVPHEQLRKLYAQTDIAVFPNRCEGGTNLVLMEYMACAKPVIATATSGHNDIVSEENALLLRRLKDIQIVNGKGVRIGRWQEPSLDELVAQIEFAYHQRDATGHIARRAGEDLQRFAWHHCAQRLVDIIEGKDVPWSGNKFQG